MDDLNQFSFFSLFHLDTLALIMLALVGFVALNVAIFSAKYLKGDRAQGAFFLRLTLLVLAVFIMVSADHLMLFLGAWGLANYLLTRLMIHKYNWQAARESGKLALRNFGIGTAFLAAAFLVLYLQTGSTSIQNILQMPLQSSWGMLAGAFLFGAAMTQSAIWPFHRWLLSSLNSPTPVSAIMHAGLVNGGGFLLARFAPLLLKQPGILLIIFLLGLITAVAGTLWKLMQHDIKRMLACSTMGQMGFMMVQCALGLFPAAIAHLCWHGLFKAYLFLSSGGAAREKRLDLGYPPKLPVFLLALVCGLAGAWGFALTSHKELVADTTLLLTGVAFLGGAQLALPILQAAPWKRLPLAILATAAVGAIYGFSVYGIEALLAPMQIMVPQPLGWMHLAGFILLAMAWVFMLFRPRGSRALMPEWAIRWYVKMLNASQPAPKTITAHHNQYQY